MKRGPVETKIKLEVHSVKQLLDREGSPFVEKRIHPEVAKAIWEGAQEEPYSQRFVIEIGVPPEDMGREVEVGEAIRYHYFWEADTAKEEIKETLKEGRGSLSVGMIVVVLLLAAAEAIFLLGSGRFMTAIGESLIIFAWVAIWSPAELLVYAHLPIRRRRNLAQKLTEAKIVLRPGSAA